jgi:hypothetical protein
MSDKIQESVDAAKERVGRKGSKVSPPPAWFFKEILPQLTYDRDKGTIKWNNLNVQRSHRALGNLSIRNTLTHCFRSSAKETCTVSLANLAWSILHNKWPTLTVRTLDGNPTNLRPANLVKSSSETKLFIKRKGSRFQAYAHISINGKYTYLGTWLTEEEALKKGALKLKTKLMMLKRE